MDIFIAMNNSGTSYTLAEAQHLDKEDVLKEFRKKFYIPQHNGRDVIYLTGNSLGLQPRKAREYVEQEFKDWQDLAVEAHFKGKNPWYYYHHFCEEALAEIAGAKKEEVAAMGSLTNNLHLLMVSFYKPDAKKYKVMMEANAFPSDQYAVQSQVKFHGYNPADAIIELKPRQGEYNLRTEDILQAIEQHSNELALVMIGGVNYLTGQFFDLKNITAQCHRYNITCGFDLAHAFGNVSLSLHDWEVDFACWCSYKYLNSGPGGVAGIFVHERHGNDSSIPRFTGWWGSDEKTRFEMKETFHPQPGAAGWQLSNAPVFPMAIHRASLELFQKAGMQNLVSKSRKLTEVMYRILEAYNNSHADAKLKSITPTNINERGCQFSLIAENNGRQIFDNLTAAGVISDWREPDVIRMSPAPMYNSFEDLYRLQEILHFNSTN